MEDMACGRAERKLFLSALDPGIGKTQTILAFLRAMLPSPDHQGVGVLAIFSRLEEVKRFAAALALKVGSESIHVITSKDDINAIGGCDDAESARVVVVTAQHLEWAWRRGGFLTKGIETYRGRPRLVKIHDETFLPGLTLTVGRDDIAALFGLVRPLSPLLASRLEEVFYRLKDWPDGGCLTMPNLTGCGVDIDVLLPSLGDASRDTMHALWLLSDRTVGVRRDGAWGQTAIHYKTTFPESWAPMLILDASGRVRATYDAMIEHRRNMVRLYSPPKDYANLKVHIWNRAAGKNTWAKYANDLTDGIAATIKAKPSERWLVVHHKPGGRIPDIKAKIGAKLAGHVPEGNVAFINWGAHMAINDYADYPNVILAGTLFYRTSQYEALHRLSADTPATMKDVSREDIKAIMEGEHKHLILQAGCRGNVRKSDGVGCGKMSLYVIASKATGIGEALPAIFPGCVVVNWQHNTAPTGHVATALKVVETWRADPARKVGDKLPFIDMAKALAIDASYFIKAVRKHPLFLERLSALPVVLAGGKTRLTHVLAVA